MRSKLGRPSRRIDMFSFRWKTLEVCASNNDTLAVWEIVSLFRGAIGVNELNVDRDAAVEWYIETQVPEESRDDYRAELQMAEDEMFEVFASDLSALARNRASVLGDKYPFVLDHDGNLSPKPRDLITAAGVAYLGLQFHRAWTSGFIELDEADEARRKDLKSRFNRWFPNLFEILASYAVAGDRMGVPHVTAHCRSSQKLHRMLVSLCTRIGSGRAKRYEDWTLEQRSANDGGVDCIIHAGGPGMPGNAYLVIVGATVQESQITKKIVDVDARNRFADFFAVRPAVFQGALVRPCDPDELTVEKCRTRDCLLYTYDDVWKNLGKRVIYAGSDRYFRLLDAKVRTLIKSLDGATLIEGFDEYRLNVA